MRRPVPATGTAEGRTGGAWPSGRRLPRPVLALLWALMAAALLCWPFLMLAPNRLVTGQGLALSALASGAQWCLLGLISLLLGLCVWPGGARPVLRDGLAALGAGLLLAGLVAAAGQEARLQSGQATALARISLGGGFWAAGLLAWAMAADALQRLPLGPGWRAAAQAGLLLPLALMLALGWLDALALMKEYANRQDVFHAALWRHGQIVVAALLPTLLIGLPLGLAAARQPALARPLLATLNLVQTVPSIALFGLLIAPLAALGAAWPASGVQGIGLLPAVIALTLYALLPVVHGLASGLQQVDPAVIDAATGMGLTARQRFWQVELPLALPLLWSALRLTTVQLIGLAVVAALIGAGGLGAIIFQGLLSSALDLVLLGVLPVVGLALVVDAGFGLVAMALARRPA